MFVNPLRMKSFCQTFEWMILISVPKVWLALIGVKNAYKTTKVSQSTTMKTLQFIYFN